MATDVQLTLEVVAEGLENIKQAEEGIKELGDVTDVAAKSAKKWVSESEKSLNAYLARFDAARKRTDDLGKALDFADGKVVDFGDDVKEAAKKTGALQKGLGNMIKGLAGVATVYAGGRFIANFTKDAIAAARAAGVMADGIEDAEKAVGDLKTSLGTELITVADPAVGFVGKKMQDAADLLRTLREQEALLDANVISQYDERLVGLLGTEAELAIAMDLVNEKLAENPELMDAIRGSTEEATNATEGYVESVVRMAGIEGLDEMPLVMARIARETEAAEQATKGFFETINRGIGGTLENAQKDLEFLIAGGQLIVEEWNRIISELETDDISNEAALEAARELEAAAIALEENLGEISAEEAAEEIASTLGVSLEEAEAILERMQARIETMDGAIINLAVITSAIDEPVTAKAGKGGGGGGSGTGGLEPGFQQGADFIVPPGFPDDAFRFRAETGERVQVTPAGRTSGSGRTVNIDTQVFVGVDIDELSREAENEGFLE